jgi:hypothetical protein
MKPISSKAHGIVDYSLGVALILAPYLFDFADLGGPAVIIPQVIGALIIGQSLFTDYELSLFKVIPMKMHLMMDYVASLFLAASPFLFGFADNSANVWMPHLVAGIGYLVISFLTQTQSEEKFRRAYE